MPEIANSLVDANVDALHDFNIIEHIWIEMSDGVRLSAKIWLPCNAEVEPVPAILEFIPYRKGDATAIRDHRNHAWFTARGYACIRPDMRGHGDSEGIMLDEYLPREQRDAVEVIDWISKQDWCSGSVGMMGISWGGISSLQAATHQPEALKAIIPVCASVDRYYDDGAYLVGGYQGQGLGWGGVMFGYCIRPPDPEVVGDRRRAMWLERLEQTPMFAEKWLRHQLRDETWVQGSVCEHYEKIDIPVLGISGWNDCWPNTMIRLLENISAPCRVVSGPWGHTYPNQGNPGPQIGFLQLALEWWDHWLKGIDNGVMDDPAFTAFIQDSHEPQPNSVERPGRWIGEADWPAKSIQRRTLWLDEGTLNDHATASGTTVKINSPLSTGLTSGEYMPWSGVAELPQDQRVDDAKSVCFDTPALTDPLELLGTPLVHLKVSNNRDCGLLVARVCDVAPDGASTLITYGILNLKLREGREQLASVTAGEWMDVTIRLNDIGWRIKRGHRVRLAISTQMWPMAWPLGEVAELDIGLASSRLDLPVRHSDAAGEISMPFEPAVSAAAPPHHVLREPSGARHVNHNIQTGDVIYDITTDGGEVRFDNTGLAYGSTNEQRYVINDANPSSARAEYRADFTFVRDCWNVRTESELIVTCDVNDFFLVGKIAAYEDGSQVFTRDWNFKIPRLVH